MTKEEFEKLSEELNTDICREIAYEYAVFVPKDEEKAISKFRNLVKLSDQRFLDKNVLENANGEPIFPYNMIMGKIDQMVESYYKKFAVGMNTKGTLTKYGSRGEKFYTYFTDCIKDSENTTKDAIKKELTRRLGCRNDAKATIKCVGDVINRRTRSLDTLLESLSKQMERCILLWEYQDKGYTKYRINATGESCDACQNMNGKILAIADATIDETLPPFHPNCDCTIEILDAQENVIHTQEKTAQDEQEWGKYLQSSFDQLIFGNYTDDVTLFGTLLQVLAGLIGVDLPMDVRDLFYDVTNFELTKEHIGQTLLDAVALLPVVGGVKYVDEAGDVLKSVDEIADTAKAVNKTDAFADFPKKIHLGKQGKHIVGHNNYREGKSIFTKTIEEAQHLVDKYSGTGQKVGTNREIVDFETIIGKYVDPQTGNAYETTIGTIHYSKDGTHIVPEKPERLEELK